MRRPVAIVGAVALLVFGAVGSAHAQVRRTSIPIPFRTYIGFNPLLVPFDIGSVEFESAIASGITFGGVGSYTSVDHDRYTTVDANVRYYPGEVVLRGFSFGLSAGALHYSTPAVDSGRVSMDAPTLGVLADYNWMLGVNRRFLVGTGLGAKRILASRADRERVGKERAYMTARFVIGYAF